MGMVTCVCLVMKFMVIHVCICLDLHTSCRVYLDTVLYLINSPSSTYFKIWYFFKYVHCFLHFTTCIKKWNQRTFWFPWFIVFFQTLGFVVTSKCWAQDSEWLLKTCVQPAYLDNGRHGVPWWTAVGQGCWLEMGYLIKRSTPTYPTFIDMIFHMINTRVLFLKFICVEHSTFFLWYIDYMHVFIPFYKKKGAWYHKLELTLKLGPSELRIQREAGGEWWFFVVRIDLRMKCNWSSMKSGKLIERMIGIRKLLASLYCPHFCAKTFQKPNKNQEGLTARRVNKIHRMRAFKSIWATQRHLKWWFDKVILPRPLSQV